MDEREQEIVKRAVGGDLAALKWLLERYAGMFAALALATCQDKKLARTAARVAMVKAGVEIRKFPREKEDFARWLARLIRHESERFIAQHRDEISPPSLAIAQDELRQTIQSAGAPEKVNSDKLNELVLNVVLALPKEERELLLLRYLYIGSYTEIGRIYGWDRYKVDERLAEARRKLWDALEAFSIGTEPLRPPPQKAEPQKEKSPKPTETEKKEEKPAQPSQEQKPPEQKKEQNKQE